jgi:hypothetical protein
MTACPNDTDGDGDCGQQTCPHCSPYFRENPHHLRIHWWGESVMLEDLLARAIADPGSVVGPRLGPSWGEGNPGYSPNQETITRWGVRAVLKILEDR